VLSLDNYVSLAADAIYRLSYLKSLEVAAVSTAILLAIGYPVAYALARARRGACKARSVLLVVPAVLDPRFLIRVYGVDQHPAARRPCLNQVLLGLRIIDVPTTWPRERHTAVYIGIVYSYFSLHGAAALCGARKDGREPARGPPPISAARRGRHSGAWTVPLSLPGIGGGLAPLFSSPLWASS